jgi:putative Mg2+ transporter-C (MgtC) family protein
LVKHYGVFVVIIIQVLSSRQIIAIIAIFNGFGDILGMNMSNILASLFDFNWELMLIHTIQMVIAFVLVLPVGFNRENSRQSIGLRTFPLVSLASCSFALLGFEVQGNDPSAMGRIVSGVVTGIGFIGGGAILKKENAIEGTSTAAAIWAAGCVGVAVAMGRLEIAILISVFMAIIFYFVSPLKQKLSNENDVP